MSCMVVQFSVMSVKCVTEAFYTAELHGTTDGNNI